MDRDHFIITVYCLVCEHYQAIKHTFPLRRGGFAPALSDEEVITMEICGEYFKLDSDKDIFEYFRTHYTHFFPRLRDRSLFVRQAANLWQLQLQSIHCSTTVQVHTKATASARKRTAPTDLLPRPTP